jgi:hypothetical protein
MKKLHFFTILLLVAQVGFSQVRTIELAPFEKVEVFGPFRVKLVKSETTRAEFDFRGVERSNLICEVKRGSLELKFKNRRYVNDIKEGRDPKYVDVTIYYNDIDVLEASAGAIVKSSEQVKSKYLIIDCSMGAEVRLDVFAKKIEAISTMGAVLEMGGQTEFLAVKAKTGGILRARNLESKTTIVRASTGADVIVYASEQLEAFAGFGASVDYVGGPLLRETSTNFGGDISRR